MHSYLFVGDIVRGAIISLGDSKQYYLSTADVELGVFHAKSQINGNIMVPVSWKVKFIVILLGCFHNFFCSNF